MIGITARTVSVASRCSIKVARIFLRSLLERCTRMRTVDNSEKENLFHPSSCWMILPSGVEHGLGYERGRELAEALTVELYAKERALSIFSYEEEAQMFVATLDESADWCVSEIQDEVLLTLLYRARPPIAYIALDPLPERLAPEAANLVSMDRTSFLRHLLARIENSWRKAPRRKTSSQRVTFA